MCRRWVLLVFGSGGRSRLSFGLRALGLGFAFGLALGFRFGFGGGAGRRQFAVLAIIGDVPAGAFELQRRRVDQAFQFAAATFVYTEKLVRESLLDFESLTALVAAVIVEWHGVSA